jgi:5-hydroxyisourate hydrolase-like protein (transthyretin family)
MPRIAKSPPPTADPVIDVTPTEAPTMELTVIKNVQEFEWNFAEIKDKLTEAIAKYNGLLVTEENLPEMEKTHREIAGLRIRVDKFRTDTKRQLSEPATKFDGEVKELLDIIRQAEVPIREQIIKYEADRVSKRQDELQEFAKSTAISMGVRDENFVYIVPLQLTQRTKTDSAARKEIIAAIEEMKVRQDSDDAAREEAAKQNAERMKLKQERTAVLEMLCQVHSGMVGLKTPLTIADVQHLITDETTPEEIGQIVITAVSKRSEVEMAAAQPPVPATPPPVVPVSFSPEPPPILPPVSVSLPLTPPIPTPPLPPTAPQLYDVTLRFPGVSVQQATELKHWLASRGMTYEVINQNKVGEANGTC